ncbi:MAG TPA: hypothetical protein VE401_03640 [Solirubrobacterales bacterium]|nr:hypothetical protein [Solirubrobacterales bacterium]
MTSGAASPGRGEPSNVAKAAVTFDDLSPVSNARRAGYVVADQAFVEVGPVTKVTYTDQKGKQQTVSGSALAKLRRAYTYGASPVPPPGDKDARAIASDQLRNPARNNPTGSSARRPR